MISRDERTVAVENASYRWSYLMLSMGLLAIVAQRSFMTGQQSWDLLGLVVAGGAVNAAYQATHGVLTRKWGVAAVMTMAVAAAVAVVMRLLS